MCFGEAILNIAIATTRGSEHRIRDVNLVNYRYTRAETEQRAARYRCGEVGKRTL